MGAVRHPPQRHRAGTVPDQGRLGAAQSFRNGEMAELANLAAFLMADGCDYLTGQTVAIDGGLHLAAGGNFARLAALGDAEWDAIRGQIRASNDKDKAQRSV